MKESDTVTRPSQTFKVVFMNPTTEDQEVSLGLEWKLENVVTVSPAASPMNDGFTNRGTVALIFRKRDSFATYTRDIAPVEAGGDEVTWPI